MCTPATLAPDWSGEWVRETIRGLEDADAVDDVFDWHPLPGPAYDLGGISLASVALPHFWPGNDREVSRRAAAESYGGPVLLAEEGLVADVG